MTDEQLQQLAALAEAATPARWIAEQGMGVRLADYTPICMSSVTGEPVNVDANMAFIAAARQAMPELLAEVSGLRRQLAEERMRANAAEFAVAQLRAEAADLRRQVDRAGYEYREAQRALVEVGEATGADDPTSPESILDALADLRRQVEHANRWRDNEILAANEARADAADLRRQLEHAQDAIELGNATNMAAKTVMLDMRQQRDAARAEAANLRRQLGVVPMDAIADLYTAYAYAVAGKPAAQEFPQVGRWLGILPADDTPHRAGEGDE